MPDGAVNIGIGQRKAAVDLSGKQYYAVRLDETSSQVKLGNATSPSMGILQNKPVTARAAAIRVVGESFAAASGTISAMDRLAPDDNGLLVTTTTDTDEYIAIALDAASYAGASGITNVMVVPPALVAG
jgi:hypothetical protein